MAGMGIRGMLLVGLRSRGVGGDGKGEGERECLMGLLGEGVVVCY